jgi:dTDP-4-amino-4,6-dideoxygalactose transaminase
MLNERQDAFVSERPTLRESQSGQCDRRTGRQALIADKEERFAKAMGCCRWMRHGMEPDAEGAAMQLIPVMRPRLPVAARIAPFLEEIDQSRVYSNFGPLARSLEDGLAATFGLAPGSAITVANATLGITLALSAQQVRPGSLCAMPAWTFAATPHAATFAGLIPYFLDVGSETWALDPHAIVDEIRRAPGFVSSVVPVAPFGRPIDVAAWDDVRKRTGLAIVIDAAAAFDSLIPGVVPSVVSLHATKVLGIGEGGCILSVDTDLIKDLQARANFGFFRSREARVPATNAKLSEYQAAVGLAALDEWAIARAEWLRVARAYRDAFSGSNRIKLQRGFGEAWVTSTCVLDIADDGADRVERALAATNVQTRRWWGRGAHEHPATVQYPRAPVPVTDGLARSAIGVPFHRDLEVETIHRIAECVHAVA